MKIDSYTHQSNPSPKLILTHKQVHIDISPPLPVNAPELEIPRTEARYEEEDSDEEMEIYDFQP
jgi:hypothetical protein